MPSSQDFLKATQSTLGARLAGSLALMGLLAASLVPGHPEAAGEHLKGKWTTPNPAKWDSFKTNGKLASGGSTHMVLLHGNGDSTWILHWHDNEYNGATPDTTIARLTLITAMSDSLYSNWPVGDSVRLFCAGHTLLRDGRAMVLGGTTVGETGLAKASIFDPRRYGEASHGWVAQSDLVYGRWYPTATTLGD